MTPIASPTSAKRVVKSHPGVAAVAAGDPSPTWTDDDFLSSACPRCDAKPGEPCKGYVAPLTTGDYGPEWHEERRPQKFAIDNVRGVDASDVGSAGGEMVFTTGTKLHTPRLARLLVTPSDHEILVRGCSCGADVTSAEMFAEHVGWPADAVRTMLRLTGLVYDVFDYHEAVTRTHIDKALETYLAVRL